MRRWARDRVQAIVCVVAGLGLGLGITACEDRTPVSTAECSDGRGGAGDPGAAEPMLVLGAATFDPVIVYADGAVAADAAAVEHHEADSTDHGDAAVGALALPMMMPGYHGDQPGRFLGGWLSDCELEAITEAAAELLTADVDFGHPLVEDVPSTVVTYGDHEVRVPAFTFGYSDPGATADNLTPDQRAARTDLVDLWHLVLDSVDYTGALEIDRLFLHVFGAMDDADVDGWPLSQPVSELTSTATCVTIDEPGDVQALLDRLASDPPMLEEYEYRLAVTAAAPGVPDCSA